MIRNFGSKTSPLLKHISTRSCVFLLEGANKMNDEFRSKMIELRTKWMHSLFKKEYGFEPTKKVGLLGEPDIKYNQLVRAHILQIVQNSILNNRISELFKRKKDK